MLATPPTPSPASPAGSHDASTVLPSRVDVPFARISGVYVRRYRMKECALEVFTRHASYLFALGGRSSMRAVVAELNARLPAGISVTARGDPEALRKLVTEWRAGKLSNFEYIMGLNTIAGRSCNDIKQYPVFPWVLADYTSPVLDLSSPRTFRDFAHPVGAQCARRRKELAERLANWTDGGLDGCPPYQ